MFSNLSEDTLAWIRSQARKRHYERGQAIMCHDDEDDSVYFLTTGRALAFLVAPDGRELTLEDIGAPDVSVKYQRLMENHARLLYLPIPSLTLLPYPVACFVS